MMKTNLFYILIPVLLFGMTQCGHKMEAKTEAKAETKTETQERPVMKKVDTTGMEYSAKYVCPMHCKGSGSDKEGTCPVCGMDYELNENYK